MGHQNNNILTKNTLKQYTLNTLKIAVIEMKGFLEVQVRHSFSMAVSSYLE